MSAVKVTVITVCYNSEKTIGRAIESVLNQTYENIEYIIVDGKSTDETMTVINSYRDAFADRLTVISEKDDGAYFAMNKGIATAKGELVGILNSDDRYEPDAVENMVNAMNRDKYQILYGFLRIYVGGIEAQVNMTKHEFLRTAMLPHPTCFVTRAVYDELGAFNTDYKSCADYDFMLRMKETGKVTFTPVYKIIASFYAGTGLSAKKSSRKEVLRMKRQYGILDGRQYAMERIKLFLKRN